jgi:ATP-binding cassette subfamily B protein
MNRAYRIRIVYDAAIRLARRLLATLEKRVDEEVLQKKPFDRKLLRRLLGYALPHWPAMLPALVLVLCAAALQVVGPLLTKLAVDRYLAPVPHREPSVLDPYLSADAFTGMAQLAALFLAAMLAGLVITFTQGYLLMRVGQWVMFRLRGDLLSHLHTLDVAYFDRQPVGRLVTRVTTDVGALNEFLVSGLVPLLGDLAVLFFLLASMIQLSASLTLTLLASAPLVIGITLVFRRVALTGNRRIRIAVARINAFLQEHITGMSVLQLFNRESHASRRFDDANREHYDAYRKVIQAYGWFYPAMEFVGILALAALLIHGGWRIQRGELTLGVLVAFFQFATRFFQPLQGLSDKYGILQTAMAAAERVFGLMDEKAAVKPPGRPVPMPAAPAAIGFDNVWFAYKEENWVLRDISFRIEPGEMIAVVGHTGAGKTTLANLLLRFYDIQRGSIRIGGVDIRQFAPTELRSRFSIVLQDPFLFTGDIGQNILLGSDGIGEQRALQAARDVNLGDFLDSLPDGLRHAVRERGVGLSTGQKQLISFARALAHDPQYLILDEATASVDTETERRIRDALDRLLIGRTSIVIAHRLSTIQRADRILVMHKGALRESGTHQQLLAQRGIYWKLYQLQYKDEEVAR